MFKTKSKSADNIEATMIASGSDRNRREVEVAPEKVGKYLIRGEVGRGAGGIVYRSYDPFVQRDVAVKIARYVEPGAQPEETEEGRSFFAEARAAGMLQHPNIVSLHDAGVEGQLFYLVMEFVDGVTLQPYTTPQGERLSLERVADIIFKCADGLNFAHSRGILHRDIKPSNIMLSRTGVPKIMDFSIAEINTDSNSGFALSRSLLGSPLYMSPEQVRMEKLTPASDLYSLGAVMFQMLTGQPLFQAPDLRSLFRQIETVPAPRVEAYRSDVPPALTAVVTRLLLKNPGERYQTGHDLGADLSRLFDRLRAQERQLARRANNDSLRRLRFFDRFNEAQIEEILNAAQLTTYQTGAIMMQEGEVENSFYIMVVGTAEVRKYGKTLHKLDKGDCYGEAGFLDGARSTCSVIATTQVLALKVSGPRLEQRSEGCQLRFYKTFLETMIYRLSQASAKGAAPW